MEKRITVIARYHYQQYFVEVTHEDSVIANRDYWLCKRGSRKKLFMFSSPYKDERTEERMILKRLKKSMEEYENPASDVKYA